MKFISNFMIINISEAITIVLKSNLVTGVRS